MNLGFSRIGLTRVAGATIAGAAVFTLCGCYSEGGLGWSEDQYVWVSRPHQPWNISLKDTRTGQEFWTTEVPIGKQLVIHFVEGDGTADTYTPDRMEWALMNDGDEWSRLDNSLPVPPANARRLDPTLRPTPELPPRMTHATTPSSGER